MDVQSLVKKGTPSVEPHDLTLIEDPKHVLYDARVHLPIPDGAILNFAAVGQAQPVSVRPSGLDELVVVDGVQRVKRALVINHLSGRAAYKGKLKPVLEAIDRLKGSDVGKRIIEEASKGMKLQIALFRGQGAEADKSALRAKASANTWRTDDVRAEKIRRAQQMDRQGISADEIAGDLGIKTVATVKRMLNADPDKPAKSGKRGKATRPSAKRLAELAALAKERIESGDPEMSALNNALAFAAGGLISEKDFFVLYPALKPEAKKAKAA